MKAMILAAGKGERMLPLTLKTHKALLPIGNETLIERHIKYLSNIGIEEIVINVSYLAQQIQNYLGDGAQYKTHIRYSIETEPLEVGGGLINALSLLGDDPFLLINCDICTDYPYELLLKKAFYQLAHLILIKNPPHNMAGDFDLENGLITYHKNKPYTYTGIALINPLLFANLSPGKQPLLPILKSAIDQGQVSGEIYQGEWVDVGTPERFFSLKQLIPNKFS